MYFCETQSSNKYFRQDYLDITKPKHSFKTFQDCLSLTPWIILAGCQDNIQKLQKRAV